MFLLVSANNSLGAWNRQQPTTERRRRRCMRFPPLQATEVDAGETSPKSERFQKPSRLAVLGLQGP
jgi:hypothetical protein